MANNLSQASEAMAAFATTIAALTHTTSGLKVFNGGVHWVEEGEELAKTVDFPCAVITSSGGTLDDENSLQCHRFDVKVEVRIARQVEGDGEPPLFGTNRENTDSGYGAGLIDSMVKLITGAGTLTPQDNAEFLSCFNYQGFTAKKPTPAYSAWVANFTAHLNLT